MIPTEESFLRILFVLELVEVNFCEHRSYWGFAQAMAPGWSNDCQALRFGWVFVGEIVFRQTHHRSNDCYPFPNPLNLSRNSKRVPRPTYAMDMPIRKFAASFSFCFLVQNHTPKMVPTSEAASVVQHESQDNPKVFKSMTCVTCQL